MTPSATYQRTCTHSTMTRVFDTNGSLKCSTCGQSPDYGWIYACTEDSDRFLTNPKLPSSLSSTSSISEPGNDADVELNGWVCEAIDKGHYTAQQIQTMKAQRANVLQVMGARKNTRNDGVLEKSSAPKQKVSRKFLARKIDELLAAKSIPSKPGRLCGTNIPVCHLRTCHRCNPGCQDRSWLSLNEVCSTSYMEGRLRPDMLTRMAFDVNFIPDVSPLLHEVNRWTTIFERVNESSKTPDSDDGDVGTCYGNNHHTRRNGIDIRTPPYDAENKIPSDQDNKHEQDHSLISPVNLTNTSGAKPQSQSRVSRPRPRLVRRPKWNWDLKNYVARSEESHTIITKNAIRAGGAGLMMMQA